MTQPQTLNVEYDELIARADELEAPFPTIPPTNPAAPCAISFAQDAAKQLGISADSMRLYLQGCDREWKSLATSLRDAAKAYGEVDEGAADSVDAALDGEPGSVEGKGQMSAAGQDCFDPPPPPPPPPIYEYPYYQVRQAAVDLENGDQGAAFEAFAQEWDAFQRELQQQAYRFRPFTSWEGEARALVEQNFEAQRQWILETAQLCVTLSDQAKEVVDAHKKARAVGGALMSPDHVWDLAEQHPDSIDVGNCDYWYQYYMYRSDRNALYDVAEWYSKLQAQSEKALAIYYDGAKLSPVNPSMFPTGSPNLKLGSGDGLLDGIDLGGVGNEMPWDESLPDPAGMAAGAGLPSMPEIPQLPDESMLNGAAAGTTPAPSAGLGSGIKAASFGGGGLGDGAPAGPLKPPYFHDASPTPPGNGAAGPGRGMPGAGGAMGGGMGGMAPMAPGAGKGQGAEKGDRKQQDQESLYTEDRPWTEGMIGLAVRRSKTALDQEMPKPPEGFMYPIAR